MDKFDELISSLKFDDLPQTPTKSCKTEDDDLDEPNDPLNNLETKLSSFKTNNYMFLVNNKDDDCDRTLDDSTTLDRS
jgi:hypothetical protein